jgi:cytochrome c oxidase cbb3-type subunit 3
VNSWAGRRGLLIAFLLATAAAPAVAQGGPQRQPDAYHELGRKVYNFRCYYCHGYSGDARTVASAYLTPKPRDFQAVKPDQLSRQAMLQAVRDGHPGTGMRSYRGLLAPKEIEAVVDFVRSEFMEAHAPNTHYHTAANGWLNHDRYKAAFPFVLGQIPLDAPASALSPEQQAGRQLYRTTCVTCHDQPITAGQDAIWESRPLSYPRNNYPYGPGMAIDAMASASPYLKHEHKPQIEGMTPAEKKGESLFQGNCSFCHGADGTGRNWIGSFLEPHARDLTQKGLLPGLTPDGLRRVILEGLPGTSMPAWKSVLSSQQVDAVVAYVFRAFARPAS